MPWSSPISIGSILFSLFFLLPHFSSLHPLLKFENCWRSKELQFLRPCLRIPILTSLTLHCCPACLQQVCLDLQLSFQAWMCSCWSLAVLVESWIPSVPSWLKSVWMSSVVVFLLSTPWCCCSCLPCDSCETPASVPEACSQTICTFLQLFVPKTSTLHK